MENGVAIVRDNSVGSVASYLCNPGFRLSGVAERVCEGVVAWANTPPICERKF